MFTREEYYGYRADIDDALNSSDFAIQSMKCDVSFKHFFVHITKKDENNNPVPIELEDVDFLKRRFASLPYNNVFKQVKAFTALPASLAEFHFSC